MQLKFPIQIVHSNMVRTGTGYFLCEMHDGDIQNGEFQLPRDINIPIMDVQKLKETTRLTRGVWLSRRKVRFVCVLKSSDDITAEIDGTEEPYFCGIIEKNGWILLHQIITRSQTQ